MVEDFADLMLVRVPNHPADARQLSQFLGSALGVAAGNQDTAAGIFATRPADSSSHILVRFSGDGTGIQHNHFSVVSARSAAQAAAQQVALQRGSVGLRGAAAEVMHKESGHRGVL